jgi:hypothetical protein
LALGGDASGRDPSLLRGRGISRKSTGPRRV